MPQRVSLTQAALNALATYLSAQLGTGYSVSPRWESSQLPKGARKITIIPAGPRAEEVTNPEGVIVSMVNSGTAQLPTVDVTYLVADCEQPVQMDVWATYHPDRDDMVAQLDDALRQGVGVTLGTSNMAPFATSLLLALSSQDGYGGHYADFAFDQPSFIDTADANGVSEFRAMYRGTARVAKTMTKTVSRMAKPAVTITASPLTTPATGTPVITESVQIVNGVPVVTITST